MLKMALVQMLHLRLSLLASDLLGVIDLRKVSLWLGHSDMGTTEVYVRADPSEKLESVEAITPPKLRRGRFEPTDKLLALLKSDSLCGAEDS